MGGGDPRAPSGRRAPTVEAAQAALTAFEERWEAMNAQLRKVTKERDAFPRPEAVWKVLYLAIMKASERWTRSVQD